MAAVGSLPCAFTVLWGGCELALRGVRGGQQVSTPLSNIRLSTQDGVNARPDLPPSRLECGTCIPCGGLGEALVLHGGVDRDIALQGVRRHRDICEMVRF